MTRSGGFSGVQYIGVEEAINSSELAPPYCQFCRYWKLAQAYRGLDYSWKAPCFKHGLTTRIFDDCKHFAAANHGRVYNKRDKAHYRIIEGDS